MSYYSDPTANAAIGAAEKELNIMRKKAQKIKRLRQQGRLSPAAEKALFKEFSGIYRHLLIDALYSEE
ncbi:MAG: hypothetical protein IJM97_02020 [Clostridia bacterium]|nr:hypothetical protein [Clostridia bacterium]